MNEKDLARTMKFEAIKIKIDMLKNIIMALVVAIFGTVSYLFVNIEKLSSIKIWTIIATAVCIALIILLCVKMLLLKIRELEELR